VVVSVSSVALDEGKAEIYAEAGISEYWLVCPEDRVVEVFRDPTRERHLSKTALTDREALQCAAIPGLEFPVADILPSRP
jgi:Uma2 family endonuclease